MNISIQDIRNLMNLAFDYGWQGYNQTKEDCISKILEDYLAKNSNTTTEDIFKNTEISINSKNNSDYYYYVCSSGVSNQIN